SDQVLQMAASLEQGSEHPLAGGIVRSATERKLRLSPASDVRAIPGKGVTGTVEGHSVGVGNRGLLDERKIDSSEFIRDQPEEFIPNRVQTAVFVAVDGRVAGLIGVRDPLKESTAETIRNLRRQKLRIVMTTGDNRATAEAVAKKLGIDEVRAEVLPRAKSEIVKQLQREGR